MAVFRQNPHIHNIINLLSVQFPEVLGSSLENGTLVTSQPPHKTNQDWGEGCQIQWINYVYKMAKVMINKRLFTDIVNRIKRLHC